MRPHIFHFIILTVLELREGKKGKTMAKANAERSKYKNAGMYFVLLVGKGSFEFILSAFI